MRENKRTFFIIAASILVLIMIGVIAFNSKMAIRNYTIETDKLSSSIKIVLITDLHSCAYGKNELELVCAIDAQSPDVVLLGGDIFDDKLPHDNAEAFIKGIANRYPCYYVMGNHEYKSGDVEQLTDLSKGYGINVLNGEYDTVEINGQRINICGITDPIASHFYPDQCGTTEQLDTLNHVADNGYYTVLLTHRPELIETYAGYNFDLVLAGHAHGGQWRIPGILNGLLAPNQGLFPKYAGGKYEVGKTTMIVSRGLARESTRVPRIFNPPELVVIEITDKK